jgi:hypothetical protein
MKLSNSSQTTVKPVATTAAAPPLKPAAPKSVKANAVVPPASLTPKSLRKIIGVTCTPAEYEQILAGAQITGHKPGPFLVACALKSNAELLRGRDLFLEKKLRDIIAETHEPKADE